MRIVNVVSIFCLLVSLLLNIQCRGKTKKDEGIEPDSTGQLIPSKEDILPSADGNNQDSLKSERNKRTTELIEKIRSVEVLTLDKVNKRIASTGEDLGRQCEKWNLDKFDIEKIIKAAKPISTSDWHYLYNVIPCYYEGEIKINGQIFSYSINAGSFINISNPDTGYIYGCADKKYKKYFLSDVWDPK